MEKTPLVSVCCITYNHAPYISQCVDGFLMQKTSFPFEIIINDDCSDDGTTEILKDYAIKYPDLIHLILHDENQYSKGVRRILATFVYPLAKGKYIALCEGDDYWTDPLKLQKQVDFLETHPEYGMIHTLAMVFVQSKSQYLSGWSREGQFDDMLYFNCVVTPTVCFRKNIYLRYISEIGLNHMWLMGDYPLWLYISRCSKLFLLHDVTSIYRQLDESASHSNNVKKLLSFRESGFMVKEFYAVKYGRQESLNLIIIREVNDLIMFCLERNVSPGMFFFKKMLQYRICNPNMYIKYILLFFHLGRLLLIKYIHYRYSTSFPNDDRS